MIDVQNLRKFYGNFEAVKDVSFTVEKGEVVGLLGPNAAGKTTIMRILTCFLPKTAGHVKVCGVEVGDDPLEVRKHIGYLPESTPLYHDMTVQSFLQFASEIKGVSPKERNSEVGRVMELAGVDNVKGRLIANISKGYKQRVGLAQSLLGDPELLILDEPTVGLDPKQIIEVRNLIKNLSEKHTVILSSHILPEVSATCGRIIIIHEGRIVAIDTQEKLSERLKKGAEICLEIKGNENAVAAELKKIKGVRSVIAEQKKNGVVACRVDMEGHLDLREDIFHACVKNNFVILEMKMQELSLEEIFLKLTTKEEIEA